MKNSIKNLATLSILVCLFFANASAVDYYVSNSGNDATGDGSSGNPWATIQYAINQVSAGNTINVAAGTYKETLTLTKGLTILGPNYNIDPNTGSRNPEAIIMTPDGSADSYVALTVQATDATLKGFTFEADNPTIDGVLNGAKAMVVNTTTNLTVQNNIIQNFWRAGMDVDGTTSANTDIFILNNKFHNIPGNSGGYGNAIFYGSRTTGEVSYNKFTAVRRGVYFDYNYNGGTVDITNNDMDVTMLGIFVNRLSQNASSTVTIKNNTITCTDKLSGTYKNFYYTGILFASLWSYTGNSIVCEDNAISGKFNYGIYSWNCAAPVTVKNTTIDGTNMLVGVLSEAVNESWGKIYTGGGGLLTLDGVTISDAPIGVMLDDNGDGVSYDLVIAELKNSTEIKNCTTAVKIKGYTSGSTAKLYDNTLNNTKFTNISSKYIVLDNNNNDLDASLATFEGKLGSEASLAENYTIEDKINHKTDLSTLGFVKINANNCYITANSYVAPNTTASIQRGIDLASSNWHINVAAGTYAERLTVNKSLTLKGAKYGVDARTRTFNDETILDGTGLTGTVYDAIKIANGVSNVIIDGFEIKNYPGSGSNGDGNGISSYCMSSSTTGANNITVQNCYIHDNAYNGILVGSENVSGESMVVQTGWTIKQNKISGSPYAAIELTNVTGTVVENNDITASSSIFDDPGDAGVGIEVAARSRAKAVTSGTDVIIKGNNIDGSFASGSRTAINILARTYSTTSNALMQNVTIENNTISGATNVRSAILLVSESRSNGPSEIKNVVIKNNTLDGNNDGIDVSDYVKSGTGTAKHTAIQINNNIIKNSVNYGLRLLTSTSSSELAVNDNSFLSNTVNAIKNEGTGTLSATCNWFGTAVAKDVAPKISGNITYVPYLDAVDGDCIGGPVQVTRAGTVISGHATIQSAIDAASAGDVINVSEGTYAESLALNKENITLNGANSNNTLITTNSSNPAIIVSQNDAIIKNIGITNSTQVVEGIRIAGATSGLTIDNVKFTNLGNNPGPGNAYGIQITNSFSNLSVSNSEFIATNLGVYSRVLCIYAPANYTYSNFIIDQNKFEYFFTGIDIRGEINGLIASQNTFGPQEINDATAAAAGIYIGDGPAGLFNINNIDIKNNTFTSYARGIYFWNYRNDEKIQKVDITDNTFSNSIYSSGIRIMATDYSDGSAILEGPLVIDNNIFNQTSQIVNGSGVSMIDIRVGEEATNSDIDITNNDITFTGPFTLSTFGMVFRGPIKELEITGNMLNGNNSGGSSSNMPTTTGIVFQSNVSGYGLMSANSNISIFSNSIKNFENGVAVYDYTTNTYGGIPTGANIEILNNEIVNNSKNIYSGSGEELLATCNWFGTTNSYSVAASISGNVQFLPFSTSETTMNCDGVGPITVSDPVSSFMTIQSAIIVANSGATINVSEGNYEVNTSITIDKNLTIIGAGKDKTSLISGIDQSVNWFQIASGKTLNVSKMKFEAPGKAINRALHFDGNGIVDDCAFDNIKGAGKYDAGTAIQIENGADVDVTNSIFTNIGRNGIRHRGLGTISGNTYTGKGSGDYLDYFLLAEYGCDITVENNTITACKGIAVSDGSTSSAIAVWDDENTKAIIKNNTISDNDLGIGIAGINGSDTEFTWTWPQVSISNNDILNNNIGINLESYGTKLKPTITISGDNISSTNTDSKGIVIGADFDVTNIQVNNAIIDNSLYNVSCVGQATLSATCNWFGTVVPWEMDAKINGNVEWVPYLTDSDIDNPTCDGTLPIHNITSNKDYGSLSKAVTEATAGDVIEIDEYDVTVNTSITFDKNLTIIGAGKDKTSLISGIDQSVNWFQIASGKTLNVSKMKFEAPGKAINRALHFDGNGIVDDCAFDNIKGAGKYDAGTAIQIENGADVDVTNSIFTNIGRNGIRHRGLGTISGNTYTGKGSGDYLDYFLLAEYGCDITVENNTITACKGIASSDGSTSSAIAVWDDENTKAIIKNNTISDNDLGIGIAGINGSDTEFTWTWPQVSISNNDILNNNIGINLESYGTKLKPTITISGDNISSTNTDSKGIVIGADFDVTNIQVNNAIIDNDVFGISHSGQGTLDAKLNWWGDISGPHNTSSNDCGTANEVSNNVTFIPFWGDLAMTSKMPPQTQDYNVAVTNIRSNKATISWTRSDGTGSFVIVREGTAIQDADLPKACTIYSSYNNNFETAPLIRTGGAKIVQYGSAKICYLYGIKRLTTYYARVCAYNGDPEDGTARYITSGTTKKFATPRSKESTELNEAIAGTFTVSQIAPNPVVNEMNFALETSQEQNFTIEIFNLEGVKVAEYCNNRAYSSGLHSINMNLNDLQSGYYTLIVSSNSDMAITQFVVTK